VLGSAGGHQLAGEGRCVDAPRHQRPSALPPEGRRRPGWTGCYYITAQITGG